VDRVVHLDTHKTIVAERLLRADEPQFAGHFPGEPIMPGVLVAEALAQTSGLLLGLSDKLAGGPPPAQPKMYFLAATSLKYTHPAKPGDILILRASADREFSGLFRFSVEAAVGEKTIASGSLMLASANGNS
jgi:3-hydroxymyristoyl/3-hydroxydecanoyl-(acyl carrier protein) dehydratase